AAAPSCVATSETPRCYTTGSIVFARSSRLLAYPYSGNARRSSYEPLPGWLLTLLADSRPPARAPEKRSPRALRRVLLLALPTLLEPEAIGCEMAQGSQVRWEAGRTRRTRNL